MRNVYGLAGQEHLTSAPEIMATAAVQFGLLQFFSVHCSRFLPLRKTHAGHPTMSPPPHLPHRAAPGADRDPGCRVPCSATQHPPATAIRSDETVELFRFMINVAKDTGYAATTTLLGTRLASGLRDTAESPPIMTPDLMADINVNSIAQAVLFFPAATRTSDRRSAVARWRAKTVSPTRERGRFAISAQPRRRGISSRLHRRCEILIARPATAPGAATLLQ
jgi:hypothetical protein